MVYSYNGPVYCSSYGVKSVWMSRFHGETTAPTSAQAATFLNYRAKAEGIAKGYTLKQGSKVFIDKSLLKGE